LSKGGLFFPTANHGDATLDVFINVYIVYTFFVEYKHTYFLRKVLILVVLSTVFRGSLKEQGA